MLMKNARIEMNFDPKVSNFTFSQHLFLLQGRTEATLNVQWPS